MDCASCCRLLAQVVLPLRTVPSQIQKIAYIGPPRGSERKRGVRSVQQPGPVRCGLAGAHRAHLHRNSGRVPKVARRQPFSPQTETDRRPIDRRGEGAAGGKKRKTRRCAAPLLRRRTRSIIFAGVAASSGWDSLPSPTVENGVK